MSVLISREKLLPVRRILLKTPTKTATKVTRLSAASYIHIKQRDHIDSKHVKQGSNYANQAQNMPNQAQNMPNQAQNMPNQAQNTIRDGTKNSPKIDTQSQHSEFWATMKNRQVRLVDLPLTSAFQNKILYGGKHKNLPVE